MPDPAPPPDRRSTAATLVVALVGILVVAGIIGALRGGNDEPAAQPTPTVAPPATTVATSPPPASTVREADAGARAACRHFHNVMRDVAAGVLTDAELREKFREVQRSASVSEEPGLPAAGTRLLASITTGTTKELLATARAFDKQCDEAGILYRLP